MLTPVAATAQAVLVGSEFQVNSYTTDVQRYPAVAARADGSCVVAWMSEHQGSSDYDIFVRRFSSAGSAPVMRVLPVKPNRKRSASMPVNTGGCTRCDAASIEAYLQTLN